LDEREQRIKVAARFGGMAHEVQGMARESGTVAENRFVKTAAVVDLIPILHSIHI
jgi:hypothetical protein